MKQLYVARPNETQDGHEYVRLVELDWVDMIQLLLGKELDIGAYPDKFSTIKIRHK